MLINHHDHQIVLRKTQNLEFCFGSNVGTNQATIETISIFRAILLELRDLLQRALGPALHVAAANARAEVSTHAKLVYM